MSVCLVCLESVCMRLSVCVCVCVCVCVSVSMCLLLLPLNGLQDGTPYAGRHVGNSPEFMPLDNSPIETSCTVCVFIVF